ncbi:MAG: sensor histidine kinase [Pseudohongiellaceae bacterium]
MVLDTPLAIRNKQFWLFQLLGWSLWVSLLVLRDLIAVPPEYIFPRAIVFSVSAIVGGVLTFILRFLYQIVWERGLIIRFLVAWFGSLAAAGLWQPFRNFIALLPYGEIFDFSNASMQDLFDGVLSISFPLLLLWSALYFIFKYYILLQQEKEKSLRSEALAHQAQLLMLRYQLNPHFLFNTLNAISTLVLSNATTQANEMVMKLSKFLRYSLDHSSLDKVTLAHELETSRLYLDIEKVRFADRLRIDIDVDAQAEAAYVPTMILQPLIENSIKYAISKTIDGGVIKISAHQRFDKLVLVVTDDGPGIKGEATKDALVLSKGVGISNIRNRLNEIYGEEYKFTFSDAEPTGLTVTVVIPYDTRQ